MRFRERGVVLAAPAVALLAFAPGAAAGPLTLTGNGPISKLTCAATPCVKTLRSAGGKPVVTLTRVRASVGGTQQSIYELAWKIGNPHVHLTAAAMHEPDLLGDIRLGSISGWAQTSAPPGFIGALNGDFFGYQGWSGGRPSGMLVRNRHIDAFGWGGPGVGFTTDALGGKPGGMVFGTPRAVADTIALPGGAAVTIGGFVATPAALASTLRSLPGDQVAVVTSRTATFKLPAGSVGTVVGGSATPTPFPTMLRGTRGGYRNPTNSSTSAHETVVGFRFAETGVAARWQTLPISHAVCSTGVCPAGTRVTLHTGQALLVARATRFAATGLARAAAASEPAVKVAADAGGWAAAADVTGGKPLLARNGVAQFTTPWADPPMMDQNPCYQWCGKFWRPALMTRSDGWGAMLIVGSSGGGVTGWQWSSMLHQLGARDAIGFDNNSSTELYVPGRSPSTGWTFDSASHWERGIAEATALSYR